MKSSLIKQCSDSMKEDRQWALKQIVRLYEHDSINDKVLEKKVIKTLNAFDVKYKTNDNKKDIKQEIVTDNKVIDNNVSNEVRIDGNAAAASTIPSASTKKSTKKGTTTTTTNTTSKRKSLNPKKSTKSKSSKNQ